MGLKNILLKPSSSTLIAETRVIAVIFPLLLLFLLVSCAINTTPSISSPVPRVSLQPLENPAPGLPGSSEETREQEWTKTINLARREGTVIVYSSGVVGGARDDIVSTFKARFGIDVQHSVAGSGVFEERMTREKRVGINSVDVYIGGSTTLLNFLKTRGMLAGLDPLLILPEVVDGKFWLDGKLAYLDKDRLILAFGINLGPQFMSNTELVTPGEVNTFRDFLNPRWKGKIALHDPTVSGTGGKSMAVTGSALLGWDAIREMVKQEPIIIRDQRLQTEWVAKGKYPLGYGVSLGIFGEFQRAGSTLLLGVPGDATYSTASGAILGLIDNAPYPNAAKLFINWLLSRDGQATIYRKMNLASRRLDVPTEGIDPILLPKLGVKYFNSDDEEWLLKQPEYMDEVKKIFAPLVSR